MTDENKMESKQGEEAKTKPASEVAAAAQSTPAQVIAPTKPTEAKKPEEPKKKERAANCAACNKSIKKKRWYYRNGKYYCTKRCWKTSVKKEEKSKEGMAGQGA